MSLLKQVVHAQCPNCKNTLRIPASWIGEPMKCKHCGTVFQAKAPETPKKKPNMLGRAIRAATTLHVRRKRKKKNKDRSKRKALQAGVPTAQPVMPGNVPVAKPMAGGPPVAIPVPGGAAKSGKAPVAVPVGMANGQKPGGRRTRGSWQKVAFVLVFFLGVGSLALIVHQANSNPDGEKPHAAAAPTTSTSATTPSATKATTSAPVTVPKSPETTKATRPKTSVFLPKKTERTEREAPPPTQKKITPPTTRKNRPPPKDTETVMPVEKPVYPMALKPNDSAYKNWPRRMLAISINNYTYQNAVSYGTDTQAFDSAVYCLAQAIRVPNDQVTMLSDRLPQFAYPTKAILEDALSRFLAESRPVDHVVVLFAGHGIEVDGVPYLVPLMGDKEDASGLISLDWLYSRLAASPAQQKLLILDIARYNPARGEEFGKTEPLGAQYAALLRKPPKGVQVLTSCAAGQYSYEIDSDKFFKIHTGVFQYALAQLKPSLSSDQKIDDPISAEDLKTAVSIPTSAKVKGFYNVGKLLKAGNKPAKEKEGEAKEEAPAEVLQTPQLYGTRWARSVQTDPNAGPAQKLVVKKEADPVFKDGLATPTDIASLLEVQRQIPPLKQGDRNDFYLQLPFAKKSLAGFRSKDDKKTQLQELVLEAIGVLKETQNSFRDSMPPPPKEQRARNQFISGIEARQKELAVEVYAKLNTELEQLKAVAEQREKESPYWKANYDYVVARLLFRMVHTFEYQAALGKIRKDELPAFDEAKHKEFALVAKEELSDREERPLADEAKKSLLRMAKEAKGTPFEVIAKREMHTSLGLQWVAK